RFYGGLRFGIVADGRVLLHPQGALYAGTPFVVVAEFASLQAMARVGNAKALLDFEQVPKLASRHRLRWLADLRGHENRAAIGLENLHLEKGILNVVMAPAHHAVIRHEDSVMLVH